MASALTAMAMITSRQHVPTTRNLHLSTAAIARSFFSAEKHRYFVKFQPFNTNLNSSPCVCTKTAQATVSEIQRDTELLSVRSNVIDILEERGLIESITHQDLRLQDWNSVDIITWPVYLVEYLAAQGFSKIYGQKVSRLRLLDGEYYRTPLSIKLTILQFLCDDIMEAEEIRAQISMQLNDEPDAETNINVNSSPGVPSVKKLRPWRVCRCLWKEYEESDYTKIDDHGSSISNQILVENVNYVGDKTTLERKLRYSQATKDEKDL